MLAQKHTKLRDLPNIGTRTAGLNGVQLAKMKKYIPYMSTAMKFIG